GKGNWACAGNVVVGNNLADLYPADNLVAGDYDKVGFVNRATGDLRLAAHSVYKQKATNGADIGVNFDALTPAFAAAAASSVQPTPPPPPPTPIPTTGPTIVLANGSDNTGAILNASTGKFGVFNVNTPEAFGSDKRTRLMLFATGISSATTSAPSGVVQTGSSEIVNLAASVSVEARTSSGQTFQLPVEYAGAQGNNLDQVQVMLIAELRGAGLVDLTIVSGGQRSNTATINVR
ncbi:MAG: hypothetical protein ACR2G4_06935, partial [Pyrinomonadaceae bacterium]